MKQAVYLAVAIMPIYNSEDPDRPDRIVVDCSVAKNGLLKSFKCKQWLALYPETVEIFMKEHIICEQDLL